MDILKQGSVVASFDLSNGSMENFQSKDKTILSLIKISSESS